MPTPVIPSVPRLFAALLSYRLLAAFVLVALTAAGVWFGTKVKPDYSTENYFPVWSETRATYDEFREDFPRESSSTFILARGDDLFSLQSLERLAVLEEDLRQLEGVIEVQGPLSIDEITGDFGLIETKPLLQLDMSAEEIARAKAKATGDALYRWNLAKPDGSALTIRVILDPDSASDDSGRQAFVSAVDPILAKHETADLDLTISGIPVIRARAARMIAVDFQTLLPIVVVVVVILLVLAFRSATAAIGALLTVAAAIVWTQGIQGLLGYSMTELSSIVPILTLIISLSDSFHILVDLRDQQGARDSRGALVHAMSRSAGPCLTTELVIAAGFLSLIAINIEAIVQFAIVSALAMIMAWAANMTVLPLVLSLKSSRLKSGSTVHWRLLQGLIGWISDTGRVRTRRVLAVAALVLVVAGGLATTIERRAHAFEGLRADSAVYRDIKALEEAHGGLVPIAIYVRRDGPGENRALEPELLRFYDRATAFLSSFEDVPHALSPSDYLREGHAVFTGGDPDLIGDGLPDNRPLASQEVELIDADGMLVDYLSFDRNSAVAVGAALDVGSRRLAPMFDEIEAFIAVERETLASAGFTDLEIHATGQLRILREVHAILVDGLLLSFGAAVLLTLLIFAAALRSVRLALIGLVPNVVPIFLALALMAAAGIDLKPTTVVLFSIVLVIADDDTMQFLARFKRNLFDTNTALATQERVDRAVEMTLMESGRAMILTSLTIGGGFLAFCASEFQALADLGLLVGTTLLFAVLADLFLAPMILRRFAGGLIEPRKRPVASKVQAVAGAPALAELRKGGPL